MAGYSGTPLAKKLGIKQQFQAAFHGLPAAVKSELKPALADCRVTKDSRTPLDFAMVFVKAEADLKQQFPRFSRRLKPAGMLWVSWPKRSSGVETSLDENVVRKIGLEAGLVDVKVCAVNDVWSGLKFVIRVKDRAKGG